MPLTVADITAGAGTATGTATFDVMMQAVGGILEKEYLENRIRDEDYATVFLGSVQACLQQAVQFELQKHQADLGAEQVLLAQAQVATEQALITPRTEKIEAEVRLLDQKVVTEEGQTNNLTTGTVGKQQLLYIAQTEGFARDAEQKAAAIMKDVYAVRRSNDSGLSTVGTGLEDVNIEKVMTTLRTGIGAV